MKIDVGFDRRTNPRKYDRIWRKKFNMATGNVHRKLGDYRYMDKKAQINPICDYTHSELLYVLSTSRCAYCDSVDQLTLDRIDNTKGHTKDNTIVACNSCNSIRMNKYTVEEMKQVSGLLYEIRQLREKVKSILTAIR